MNKPVFKILQWTVLAGILVFLTVGIVRERDVLDRLAFSAGPHDVVIGVAFAFAGVGAMPLIFTYLLRAVGLYRPAHRLFYFRIWLQSFFYRYIPGKVLLVVERIRLGRQAGLSPEASGVLVIWEMLLYMLGGTIVAFGCLGLTIGDAGNVGWIITTAVGAVAALALLPKMLKLLSALPWEWTRRRFGALTRLKPSYRSQCLLVGLYAVGWILMGSSYYWVFTWFAPLGWEHYPTVLFWFVASYLSGIVVTVAPAGLGVREAVLAAGLSTIISPSLAVALAIGGRIVMTIVEILCLALSWLAPVHREPPCPDGNGVPATPSGADSFQSERR